ncbi:terminase small subunit [Niallia endozanthoxylica]|uniref:Terminase small subunit n=1 Tax=Niallia endozanthoxylica TaxID=2036016 RepID=A0A5J5GVQ2_9BACI|nr:terminase small subunit [Niallia endozanthoxylica]KAA9012396.1 terminase small subunit [Niallia endozanthoxylica]
MSKEKLTAKQESFIREYLKDKNATQAAIRAGYSKRRASEIGYQLLRKTTVSEAIIALQAEIEKQLRMQFVHDALTAREVLYNVMVNPNSSDRDKIVAARDLLDRAGFKPVEKKEMTGSDGGAIEITFVEPKY